MNAKCPRQQSRSEQAYCRTLALLAFLVAITLAGAVWLVLRSSPLLSPPGLALLSCCATASLALFLLWRSGRHLAAQLRESRRNALLLEGAPDGILTIDSRGRVLSMNPAAERSFGRRSAEMIGQAVTQLLADPPQTIKQNFLRESVPLGSILGLAAGAREVVGKRRDGETLALELTGQSVRIGDEEVSVAFVRDVSKRKRAQRYLTAHYAATCILSESPDLDDAMPRILRAVCEALGWEAGAYWAMDDATGLLHCGQLYRATLGAMTEPPAQASCPGGKGLVGRAWETGKPASAEDVQQQAGDPCAALAAPLHLRGALALPISDGQQTYGVMTFFSTQRLRRDDRLHDVVGEVGRQFGQFIARKRDQQKLAQSEERFRQLAENIHQVFWMADAASGSLLYVSPSFEEVWGRPAAGIEGLGALIQFTHAGDRDRVLAALERQRAGEETSEECRIVRADGEVRWIWDRAFPIRDAQGQIYRIAGITADVTERKRTEKILLETTDTLQALVRACPVAVALVDPVGKVRLWNPAAERIFGWPAAEITGMPLPLAAGLSAASDPCHAHQGLPIRCRKKDGSPLEVSLWSAPLHDPAGAVCGAVSILMDLTEQKKLEEQLRQAQKMESVGRLAGGVAHDFNNLLTVINGYSELLLTKLGRDRAEHDLVAQVLQAGERASALTRQLLAFGRKQHFQARMLDLNSTIQNLGKMLRRLIGEDVELVMKLDPAAGRVLADPGQIDQILMNLATNARDAMPHGGTLTIRTADYLATAEARPSPEITPGRYVLISVADTGSGMDEATQARVFEPFFTTKELGKGTGLGLATVYGIVKQSQGHVEVDSEPGKGTTFRIYLPRLEQAHEGREVVLSQDCPRGSETLLLVEDEEGVRTLLSRLLRQGGYEVLEARTGEEALHLAAQQKERISLLVTDVVMPRMNGRQLAEQLRAWRPGLRVLYVSGYTQQVLDSGVGGPGEGFLTKPLSHVALARKVRELLDGPSAGTGRALACATTGARIDGQLVTS